MPESLRSALADLRASCVPFYGLGAGAFYPVMVRPSLGFAMVPRPRERPEASDLEVTAEQRRRNRLERLLEGPAGALPGLVEGPGSDANDQKPRARQGFRGLSAAGKNMIEDLCSIVREDRGLYGIWTVTLPPSSAQLLDAELLGATVFSDVLRRRFGEMLARAAKREGQAIRSPVPAHWWFVIEPQKQGRPHWHFVFRCKSRRGRGWLLGKGSLDRLIRNAIRTVTGQTPSVRSAGNVQALRSDPGRYLSKYLRKDGERNGADVILAGGWSENLVPCQWWGCSKCAREMLQRYRFELPSYAVGWLSRQWPLLDGMGLIQARIWQPDSEGAPSIVVGSWLDVGRLRRVIRHLFEVAQASYDSGRTFGTT